MVSRAVEEQVARGSVDYSGRMVVAQDFADFLDMELVAEGCKVVVAQDSALAMVVYMDDPVTYLDGCHKAKALD